MARFLTTKGSIARIEEVITFAQRELYLITPFVQLTDAHIRRLRDADARGVRTSLVCRYDDLKQAERTFFASLDHACVFDDPDLHAKCFVNERGLVLTSLNLYGASEKNNEVGVWLDASDDAEAYTQAVDEIRSIREHAQAVATASSAHKTSPLQHLFEQPTADHNGRTGNDIAGGVCIRCEAQIDYNPNQPYCLSCYRVWKRWGDPNYEESHCHACGSGDHDREITMAKPQCYECYQRYKANVAA